MQLRVRVRVRVSVSCALTHHVPPRTARGLGQAVEVVDSSAVSVVGCTFDQVGGNGVLLSNNVQGSSVRGSEFVRVGDSAVVMVGSSDAVVGTAPTYPQGNTIASNHMHETGIFGKQTSCVFQALGQNNTVRDNLCYNGPRAGINWNDGFAGGSTVQGNLVFNQVRETGDHGQSLQSTVARVGNPLGFDGLATLTEGPTWGRGCGQVLLFGARLGVPRTHHLATTPLAPPASAAHEKHPQVGTGAEGSGGVLSAPGGAS